MPFQTALVPLPRLPAAQFVPPAFDALLPPAHQPSLLAGSSVLGGRNSFGDAHGHFTCTQKTGKAALEGASGGTDRQKKATELWAGHCPVCLKASCDMAETTGEVADTDAIARY